MKILFVLDYYVPHVGGIENFFRILAEGLASKGNDVHVLTWRWRKPNLKGYEIRNKVKIHRVWARSRYTFALTSLTKVFGLAKDADIIHTTTYQAAPAAFLAASILRKPCIITFHEFWGKQWMRLGFNPLYAKFGQIWEKTLLMLPFAKIVVPSRFTKFKISNNGLKQDKIEIVYHGIDYELFNPKKFNGKKIRKKLGLSGKRVYTFFGRPGASKGLEYFIRSMPKILEKVPKSKFLLIVSRDPSSRYKLINKMINELRLEKHIVMLDPVPRKRLPDYLAASDCIVIPSLSEGFGFAAAEACAMEKPVVVSKVTSLPEVVSGRVLFVPPKNHKAIAKACINVYKGKYKIIPKKSFSWNKNILKYLKIYKEALHEN